MGTPPFNPGDKVVYISQPDIVSALDPSIVYTVKSVAWCCKDVAWRVWIIEADFIEMARAYVGNGKIKCARCEGTNISWTAIQFRKIEDVSNHTVDSLLEELSKSKPVRELQPA